MRLSILVVGRTGNGPLADAVAAYEQKAARYWPIDFIEVKECSSRSRSVKEVISTEAENLLKRIPAGAKIISCNPSGKGLDSLAFADMLRVSRDSASDLAFVIGGAWGLGEEILSRSFLQISLAPFILPHDLARLVLVEQVYRAGTILRGEPYHK